MNPYRRLGVTPLINAAGSLTILGGSIMHPQVTDAMAAASRYYVDIRELQEAAGRRAAELVGAEAAHVCACSSAGISLMAAACMAGSDPAKIARLPDSSGMKNQFVVHKVHRNRFDHALHVAGGRFVEIETCATALAGALSEQVAALYYTYAWYNKGEALPLSEAAGIAHEAGVPVIVDAAAQVPPVENLSRFLEGGADMVVFSGGKAMRGPQTSAVILGSSDLIRACAMNASPNTACIGRGMKIGKEEIMGLVRTIELYVTRDHSADDVMWEQMASYLIESLLALDGVQAVRKLPGGPGGLAPFVAVWWDEDRLGISLAQAAEALDQGRPRIAVRLVDASFPDVEWPQMFIHPHTLKRGEEIVVARRLAEVLS
jgi:L-seryl-tRNA(Ser) seleniumtransferase